MQQLIALLSDTRARWATPLHAWIGAEQGRFALFLPVFMGAGVALYFALPTQPPAWAGALVALPALAGALLAAGAPVPRALLAALAAAAVGFGSAQLATIRAPPLPVLPSKAVILTGQVRSVELLPAGRRVTLEAVRLGADAPIARTVRIRLRPADDLALQAGDTLRVRALIRSPPPPAWPGAWDLQRDAFFAGVAGYGYALNPAERLAAGAPGWPAGWVRGLRDGIGHRILAALPGAAGGVAATLLTGLTSAIPEPDRAAFRDSGLAHLLAVAGLHIGIVMGLILGLTRLGLAAWPYAALHWPARQLAALTALAAGAAYLVLTGAHVPIIRSFAMACLFTLAVVAGRRAVSLRGLALAAAALLLAEPEQLVGVSFQMSFSAVLALIVGYDLLRPHLTRLRGDGSAWRRFALHVAALALTSFLAGTASAPFAAFHFGHVQLYYVVSNMLAVPLTALWVMPAGLAGLALMPLGLERFALVPMGWGVEGILWIARATAALPAATLPVPHMPPWGLGVLALGMAWAGLWRSRARLAGLPVIALGLASPIWGHPADLLVSADARLIGLRTADGVFLQSGPGASKFTRDAWLQYWAASEAAQLACAGTSCRLQPAAGAGVALLASGGRAAPGHDCAGVAVVVSAEPARGLCDGPLVDRFSVWRDGAYAVWLPAGGPAILLSDRQARGDRPWVPGVPTPRNRAPDLPRAQTDE